MSAGVCAFANFVWRNLSQLQQAAGYSFVIENKMSKTVDRSWAEIDAAALRHNLKAIRRAVPKKTGILAVIKANGYGHGVEMMARACSANGVKWFGVANLVEAIQLRELGFTQSILLLSAVLPEEREEVIQRGFVAVVSSLDEAKQWSRAAQKQRRRVRLHFKIDIGMGRLGLWHEDAAEVIAAASALPAIELEGLMTHFPSSDENETITRWQWRQFDQVRQRFPKLIAHVANSAAIFLSTPTLPQYELVRPGIALYGAGPTPKSEKKLRPLLTWKSRITHIDRVPAGRTISYGSTYQVPKPETHAVVAVGYADGYHRLLSNRAEVLIGGKRCPLRGRVTMDQIVIDISRVPKAKIGDEVVLIGRQGKETITANEMARWAGTISYEIFTSISPRVRRH